MKNSEIAPTTLVGLLRQRAAEVETLTSVCTGSMLLGFAGLLDGLHATTHWKSLDWMRDSFPSVTVEYDQHVVEDGRVLTSAGISAGIDMALALVEADLGAAAAKKVEGIVWVTGQWLLAAGEDGWWQRISSYLSECCFFYGRFCRGLSLQKRNTNGMLLRGY